MEISLQFWPWNASPEIVSYAKQALRSYPYDCIWMCDEFQYEDTFGTLLAMAIQEDTSVGTMVTFPWRNPLELAQRFATIAKFTKPGRHVACGIGAGGSVQVQVVNEKSSPVAVMRESVQFLRGLFAGEQVELSRFPTLGARFGYNPKNKARLYFPPPTHLPVVCAAAGPKMYEVAGAEADGVILSQLPFRTSYLGVKAGLVHEAMEVVDRALAQSPERPFTKIYNIHVSVSRDGKAAKQWAKRNTSYPLAGAHIRYPKLITRLGLDPDEVAHVAEAYVNGLGLEEAARRISDDLVQKAGCVFSGTPDEVAEQVLDIYQRLSDLGFDHLVIGVPLGPNVPEALDLISTEVLPPLLAKVPAARA